MFKSSVFEEVSVILIIEKGQIVHIHYFRSRTLLPIKAPISKNIIIDCNYDSSCALRILTRYVKRIPSTKMCSKP